MKFSYLVSLLLAAFYASEIAVPDAYYDSINTATDSIIIISFVLIVAVGMTIFHHIGVSLYISIVFYAISLIFWIAVMKKEVSYGHCYLL